MTEKKTNENMNFFSGNSINHNITWRDLINETWVSQPLPVPKELASDEELFGRVMKRIDA